MAKKLFSDVDFDKSLSIDDELVFDKPELTKLRVDLTWAGTDLDICAFLLGEDGMIHDKADLVYFRSLLRWKTTKAFTDADFNPLEGEISTWPSKDFKNPNRWLEGTLPISSDGAVIGSWDDMDDTGGDEECGETMHVLLDEVDTNKHKSIVFAACVARDRIANGETFADAHDPVVTIYNAENDEVVAEYKLASKFPGKDAVCLGRLDFDDNTFFWNFVPMAEGYNGGMHYLATEIFN
ncbi:MAG: TerD family protein [Bacteroidales bacterium]|nr:TerD family protein [Bacteroidales bacterium]